MTVHKTQIANRDRPFEWSSYCRCVTSLTANFRFRSFSQPGRANYSKTMRAGRKMSKDTYSNSGSADRLVMLLQQCGATCWISALSAFRDFQSTNISETVEAG
jgi:hypothetical protein